ncbi:MAG: hypothetical protein AAF518_26560 [Spirochaetota bacterium]
MKNAILKYIQKMNIALFLFLLVPGVQAKWSRSNFSGVANLSFQKQAIVFFDAFFQEIGGRNGAEIIYSKYRYMVKFHLRGSNGKTMSIVTAQEMLSRLGGTHSLVTFKRNFRKIDLDRDGQMSMFEFLVHSSKNPKIALNEFFKKQKDTLRKFSRGLLSVQTVAYEISDLEKKKKELVKNSQRRGVKGRAAQHELKELKNSDPLELNRALVTAEATIRKATRRHSRTNPGATWWLQREIDEFKRYKP